MTMRTESFYLELSEGERFEFGANWERFLSVINEERIAEAEASLKKMLGQASLDGQRFLDVGSGSGLFSLAARRLGARVHSFDYDPASVACAGELKRRYRPDDVGWVIEHGSALDPSYLAQLGRFSVVYSWGVLHHTGAMWAAMENIVSLVDREGRLFIAIYNDQGSASRHWRSIKAICNKLPSWLRPAFSALVILPYDLRSLMVSTLRGRPGAYFELWSTYRTHRGMSRWHDIVDWVGGYPFEVATPDEVFEFYKRHDFVLDRLTTTRSWGCNEFVFHRAAVQ